MIRWKNKNPYLNLVRESKNVVLGYDDAEDKLEDMQIILQHDFTGDWLFSHPSEKYSGNGVPHSGSDNNPYYTFLQLARTLSASNLPAQEVITSLSKALAWLDADNRLQDWAVTE